MYHSARRPCYAHSCGVYVSVRAYATQVSGPFLIRRTFSDPTTHQPLRQQRDLFKQNPHKTKKMTSPPPDHRSSSHRSSSSPSLETPIPDSDLPSLPLPLSASIILTSLPPDASTALAQALEDVDKTPVKGAYCSRSPSLCSQSSRGGAGLPCFPPPPSASIYYTDLSLSSL